MAELDCRCAFLRLPREIRDQIYDYLQFNFEVSSSSQPSYTQYTSLDCATSWNLLSVSRQIHDEYHERVVLKSVLLVAYGHANVSSQKLLFAEGFPVHLLREVKRVSIFVPYVDDEIMNDARTDIFWQTVEDDPEQAEVLEWTPSLGRLVYSQHT